MTKRGVPKVMSERDSLRQILVQPERARDGAGNLRDLKRVSQARPGVVALWKRKNLGLVFQAAEGFAVYDSVAIALKGCPQRAKPFFPGPAPALSGRARPRREPFQLVLFPCLSSD
jgi:hypothetical protein